MASAEQEQKQQQEQPQQPKKVTGGAFGRFLAEQRAALTEECKGKPATAVVKLASERFKALSEAERKSYDDKLKEAVQQYEKDMEAFLAAGGEKKAVKRKAAEAEKTGKGKKEKDPEAPKKPVGGAYGVFSNEKREEFTKAVEAKGEKGFGPVAKMTSEAFKALSEEEKAAYEEKYAQKVAAYKEALAAYTPPEKPAAPATITPKKRGRASAGEAATASAAKRGRKAGGEAAPPAPDFEADVVAAADKEGLMGSLGNLARRPEIIAKGFKPMELLSALKKNGGLVNKTKAALLGGA